MLESKSLVLCLLAALVLCKPTSQVAAQDLPPNVPPPAPVNFQMPAVHRLKNGLRIVLIERKGIPIVQLYAIVETGAKDDPPALPGTASLVAGLLPEGTKRRSAYQIAQAIDRAGGSIDTGAGWDESYANVSALADHKDLAFKVLSSVLIHPDFAPQEIQRLRAQTLSALDVVNQDSSYVADVVLRRVLFAGTSFAHPEDGTRESIERITREDLVNFHNQYYVPSRTILAVVGDITEPECLRLAAKYLGDWKNATAGVARHYAEPHPLRARAVLVINKPGAVQTVIRVANLGIPRSSPDYAALSVANQVLGGPAANRLFDILRTEHGLVYGASSDLDCYSHLGMWVAKTSTRSADTIKATEMVLNEIARLRKRPVRQWELQNAQDYLIGHEALQFDSASQVANQVLEMMLYHLPPDYWNQFPKEIRSLTASDALATTRKYLDPDDDVIVLVGNVSAFKSGLKKLGPVRVVPIADVPRAFLENQKGTADRPASGR